MGQKTPHSIAKLRHVQHRSTPQIDVRRHAAGERGAGHRVIVHLLISCGRLTGAQHNPNRAHREALKDDTRMALGRCRFPLYPPMAVINPDDYARRKLRSFQGAVERRMISRVAASRLKVSDAAQDSARDGVLGVQGGARRTVNSAVHSVARRGKAELGRGRRRGIALRSW